MKISGVVDQFSVVVAQLIGLSLWLGLSLISSAALAQTVAKEGPTLELEAQSRLQVPNDEMQVLFAIERDGTDLAAMNQAVLQSLNSAIADAKKVDGVKARMGSVYTNPNWTAQGKTNGWKVRGEISLQSKNFSALGNLVGQLSQRLQMSGVQFRLSDDTRVAAEKDLIKSSAASFRAKAQEAAVALGFKSFEIKAVNLNGSGNTVVRPVPMMKAMRSEAMSASAPMPAEGGESEVIVSFSGSVYLK